jgi:DNA polymerase I
MTERPLVVAELNPPFRATLVVNEDGLRQVQDFLSRVMEFGLDVETNVTDSFVHRKLRTIQIGNREEQYVIDLLAFAGSSDALKQQGNRKAPEWATPLVQLLSPYLASKTYLKHGFNLQFDYEAIRWNLGIKSVGFYDCLLAEKVIYAGQINFFQSDFWGADDIFARYTGLRISKDQQKGFDLETPLTPEQVEYAALDVRIPFPVKNGQAKLVDPAGLRRVVEIENSAIPAFGEMHLNGFLLSADRWMSVVNSTKEVHKENVKRLDTFFVSIVGTSAEPIVDLAALEAEWKNEKDKEKRQVCRKTFEAARRSLKQWKDNVATYEGEAAINYASTAQLLKALRKYGFSEKELPDTNDRTLSKLSSHPIIKAVQEYRTTAKALTTYGVSFLENINPDTGRVHSNINQLGAATGRTSSSSPNVQNIPQGSDYRSCFVARPGYVFVTVDMSGAELRILAEESGEPAWVEAFAKGWDVHSVGAEIIFGDEWVKGTEPSCAYYNTGDHQKCSCKKHKELRNYVKALNFGIAYGMEAQKLADALGITKKEAQALLDRYRATFKQVTAYLKRSGESAKMNLFARTLAGRRRLFTKPTWEAAKEKARQRAIDDKKDPNLVGSKDVSRAYASMYGSIEREGKNSPIQGLNADLAKLIMGDEWMFPQLEQYGAEMVCMVHDEFDLEVPEEHGQAVFEMVGRCIQQASAEFLKKVTMEFDGGIDTCWSK